MTNLSILEIMNMNPTLPTLTLMISLMVPTTDLTILKLTTLQTATPKAFPVLPVHKDHRV
jgi:hypothetical protein